LREKALPFFADKKERINMYLHVKTTTSKNSLDRTFACSSIRGASHCLKAKYLVTLAYNVENQEESVTYSNI